MSFVCVRIACDSEYNMATGGLVTGIVVKIVPSFFSRWFDSTIPWRPVALTAGSRSGGDIIPCRCVWNERYCSMRNSSGVVLPYHVGRYQHGFQKSRARDISMKYEGLK